MALGVAEMHSVAFLDGFVIARRASSGRFVRNRPRPAPAKGERQFKLSLAVPGLSYFNGAGAGAFATQSGMYRVTQARVS